MKIAIIISLCILCIFNPVYSQITVRELNKKDDTSVWDKPMAYDSLDNFLEYGSYLIKYHPEHPISSSEYYEKYVGLQIYLPLVTLKCINEMDLMKKRIGTEDFFDVVKDSEEVCNKYFTIIDELGDDFIIMDNLSRDTLRFNHEKNIFSYSDKRNQLNPFILVPYYIKLKELFNDKKMVAVLYYEYKNSAYGDAFLDPITNKLSQKNLVKNLSKWHCEISLLKNENEEYIVSCSFTSDLNQTLLFDVRNHINSNFFTTEFDESPYGLDGYNRLYKNAYSISFNPNRYVSFIPEECYLDKLKKEKNNHSTLTSNRKKEEQIKTNEREEYKLACINKYGKNYGECIAQKKVKIGMTIEMCIAAWGEPYNKTKTITENSTSEDYYYGWHKSLHFENGNLSLINE